MTHKLTYMYNMYYTAMTAGSDLQMYIYIGQSFEQAKKSTILAILYFRIVLLLLLMMMTTTTTTAIAMTMTMRNE